MFYALLALLATEDKSTSKHSVIISLFDRKYVRNGIFAKDYSKWLHEAFDLRQRADYREMFRISSERAKTVLENATSFVAAIKDHIESNFM